MLTQALIQLGAVLQLIPPGAVPPATPPVAATQQAQAEVAPVQGQPFDELAFEPSPAEFEHICEIRKLISGQHQPLADSPLIGGSADEFRSTLFSEYQVEAPVGDSPPTAEPRSKLRTELRQVGERLDSAANRLERRQLYETADELRELAQRLRQLSRAQGIGTSH